MPEYPAINGIFPSKEQHDALLERHQTLERIHRQLGQLLSDRRKALGESGSPNDYFEELAREKDLAIDRCCAALRDLTFVALEHSAFDDRRGRRRGNDRVVVGACDGLVDALLDDDARRDHAEPLAGRVPDGRHFSAAARARAQLGRHRVGNGHALEMSRERTATSGLGAAATRFRVALRICRRRPLRDQAQQRQGQLALDPLKRLGTRTLTREVSETAGQLQVEIAHARDERHDSGDELDEPHRGDHLLEPCAKLVEVGHLRRCRRLPHPTR